MRTLLKAVTASIIIASLAAIVDEDRVSLAADLAVETPITAVVSANGVPVATLQYSASGAEYQISVSTPLDAHFFALANPARIVLDIESTLIATPMRISIDEATMKNHGLAGIRLGEQPDTLRVVFDLSGTISTFIGSTNNATATAHTFAIPETPVLVPSPPQTETPITMEPPRFPVVSPRVVSLVGGALPVLDLTVDSSDVLSATKLKLHLLTKDVEEQPLDLSLVPQRIPPGTTNSRIRVAALSSQVVSQELTYTIDASIGEATQTIGFVLIRPATPKPAIEWTSDKDSLQVSNNGNISGWFCFSSTLDHSDSECASPGEGTLLLPGGQFVVTPLPELGQLLCINYGESMECSRL